MSYFYLGTPYSKFEGGLDAAFRMASEATAKLIRARVPVFSPIVHSHPVAQMGGLDPLDWQLWLASAEPFMRAACGLLIYKAPGWRRSFGIAQEVKAFRAMKKPVRAITPASINDPGVHAVLAYAAAENYAPHRGFTTFAEVRKLEERDPPVRDSGVEDAGSSPAGAAITREEVEHAVTEAACARCGQSVSAAGAPCSRCITDDSFEIPAFLRRQPASAEVAQP